MSTEPHRGALWQKRDKAVRLLTSALFVMRPHAEDFYDMLLLQDLIDKPMLNVDATGNRSL